MRARTVILLIAAITAAGRADADAETNGGLRLQIHGTPRTVFRQVDFAADKRLLVTSGSGGVTFWDAQRGLELGSYLEDWQSTAPRFVQGVMTPDGREYWAKHYEDTIVRWDLSTLSPAEMIKTRTNLVDLVLARASNGGKFVTWLDDTSGEVWLWERASDNWSKLGGKEAAGINSLAFDPDTTQVAVGRFNGTLEIWDPARKSRTASTKISSSAITAVAATPAHPWLLAVATVRDSCVEPYPDPRRKQQVVEPRPCPDGAAVHIFSAGDGQIAERASFAVPGGYIRKMEFSSDGNRVAVSNPETTEIWAYSPARRITGIHMNPTYRSQPTCCMFALEGDDSTVMLNFAGGELFEIAGSPARVTRTLGDFSNYYVSSGAFAPSGEWRAAILDASNHRIRLTGLGAAVSVRTLAASSEPALAMLSADGSTVYSDWKDASVRFWSAESGQSQCVVPLPEAFPVYGARAISANGDFAAVFDRSNRLVFLRRRDCSHSNVFHVDKTGIDRLQFSYPDSKYSRERLADVVTAAAVDSSGRYIAFVKGDNYGYVLEADSGRTVRRFRVPVPTVESFRSDNGQITNFLLRRSGGSMSVANFIRTENPGLFSFLQSFYGVKDISFDSTGALLTTTDENAQSRTWDWRKGEIVATYGQLSPRDKPYYINQIANRTVGSASFAVGPGGRFAVTTHERGETVLWDLSSGHAVRSFTCPDQAVRDVRFSADGRYVASSAAEGRVCIWDVQTGTLLISVIYLQAGAEWLAFTPDGLFDGTAAAYERVGWRFTPKTYDVMPVDAYLNEFYHPGLVGEILSGGRPKAPRQLAHLDRRSDTIRIEVLGAPVLDKAGRLVVKVKIRATEALPGAEYPRGSGIRDLRLFRNGELVRVWRGDLLTAKGADTVTITTSVALAAGQNRLTAYCFNTDNVKSADFTAYTSAPQNPARKGTAYIVAFGLNDYENHEFNLQFARADARLFADTLSTELSRLGRFADIKTVLVDDSAATKENILEALHRLDPFSPVNQTPNTPAAYAHLTPAGPEDAVYLFFAGHGWARENRFYLVPHDLGYNGKRTAIGSTAGAIDNVIAHAISDLDLASALEKIDAGQLLLVVDACNSGQALESEEKRQGPFNSKGLAQLAFDKGMYVLTAAQSYQAALENSKLGHGYLTYALVEEGLKEKKADVDPHDGEVTIREWLDYAVNRVPELQAEASTKSRLLVHHDSAATPRPKDSDLQVPRAFYRVDEYRQDIVARQ